MDGGSFISGAIFGFFFAYLFLAYMLLGREQDCKAALSSSEESSPENEESKQYHEKSPTAAELQLLDNALISLNGSSKDEITPLVASRSTSNESTNSNGTSNTPALLTKNLVLKFTTYSTAAKERQKHIKAFGVFLDELGKVHGNFGKALQKVSVQAESHVVGKNAFLDKWWNSLAIALDHMSQDQMYVCSALCLDIKAGMTNVETEHDHLEKHIYSEGSKLLNKLRDMNDIFTAKKKEFEKIRERSTSVTSAATTAITPTSPPASSTPNPTSSISSAANSAASPTSTASQKTSTTTPNPTTTTKSSKYEAALRDANEATSRLTNCQKDFDEKMPRMLADYELMASNGQSSMMALLIKLTNLLTEIQLKSNQVTDRLKMDLASSAAKDADSNSEHNYNPVIQELLEDIARHGVSRTQMDMTLESSAGVASSLFTHLPPLPPQFQNSIAKETCVWFNAFNGRIYRDAARSEYFNNWFCVKVAHLLNKGKKSALIDDYHVSEVKFGSLPPLIRNMQWIPITKETTDPSSTNERDVEYDIDCTADIAFRSGISFTVTTRLWINWPVEKYAFIPMSLQLECTELCGKVRFGVMKQHSFISFVGEPFTRFSVKSEVGDQYKLKNLPKISTVVINKIKKHIRSKLVYPQKYRFRLMWPKKWWPEVPLTPEEQELEAKKKGLEEKDKEEKQDKGVTISAELKVKAEGEEKIPPETPHKDSSKTANVPSVPKTSWGTWFSSSYQKLQGVKKDNNDNQNDNASEDSSDSVDTDSEDERSSPLFDGPGEVTPVDQPDHVRLYVSALLRRASNKAPLQTSNGRAQDDILIQHKNPSNATSIAIVRARSHSISEFRHAALEVMWAEFLGSIGHDFSALSALRNNQKESTDTNSDHLNDVLDTSADEKKTLNHHSPPKSSTVRHRRRRILASMRDRLLGKHPHHKEHHAPSVHTSNGKSTGVVPPNQNPPSTASPVKSQSTPDTPTSELSGSTAGQNQAINARNGVTDERTTQPPHPPSLSTRQSSLNHTSQTENVELIPKDTTATRHVVSPLLSPTAIANSNADNISTTANFCANMAARYKPDVGGAGTVQDEVHKPTPDKPKVTLHSPVAVSGSPGSTDVTTHSTPSSTRPTDNVLLSTSNHDHNVFTPTSKSKLEAATQPAKSTDGYRSRLSMVVGSLRKVASTPTKTAPAVSREEYDAETRAMQEEAMKLTWQAQAEVITVAAMSGEHPSMQNFMRAPQQAADKCWVVLKHGYLHVYPNNSRRDKGVAMDSVQPLKEICLYGCSCRPMEQKNGFEIGVVKLTDNKTLTQIELSRLEVQRWVPFYTEMAEQCRVWIMAIQFSATMHRYVEK